MADSNVTLKFFGSPEAAERAIVALEKKFNDLENKIRQTARTSKDAGFDFAGPVEDLGRMLTGLVSIQAAVGAVTAMWRDWKSEIDQASQQEQKFSRQLLTDLTMTGDLLEGGRIKDFLQNIPGVREEQARAAFGSIRAGGPSLPLDDVLGLTQAVSALSPLLAPLDEEGQVKDVSQLKAIGNLTGKIREIAPDVPFDDVVDLALAASKKSGGALDALQSGKYKGAILALQEEKGMSLEEAMATASEAGRVGIQPRALVGFAFGKKSPEMALLDAERIAAGKDEFGRARVDDWAVQLLEAGRRDFGLPFARQRTFAADEKSDRPIGEFVAQRDAERQAAIEEAPPWARWLVARATGLQAFFESIQLADENATLDIVPTRRQLLARGESGPDIRATEALLDMRDLLKDIRDQGDRPLPLNRDAQTE